MNFPIIPKPPTSGDQREMYRWQYLICEVLNGLKQIIFGWNQLTGTVNFIPMEPAPTVAIPTTEGTLSWDPEHECLNVQPANVDALLQVGQEEWVHVINNTGTTILNGSVVSVSGASGDHSEIALTLASATGNVSNTLGVATTDILSGSHGFVTVRGMVHGYDTSVFPAGSILYVSDSVPGGLTSTQPMPPSYTYAVAIPLDSAVDGIIYVRFGSPDASIKSTNASVASKDPSGWNDNANIAQTYNSTDRTITLTGNLQYSWRGAVRTIASPWTSSAHSATNGTYFLYSVDGVNFTWSTTPWTFSDLMIAFVDYGAADKYSIREVHGLMPWQAHEEFHQNIGTYLLSGGTLSGYVFSSVTPANRRPIVSAALIKDEDLQTTNPILNSSLYTKMFLASTGTTNFTVETADIVPLSGANPYWNQFTGGAWQQTLMSNNSYMNIWLIAVPMASDISSQKYRYLWMQGQSNGTLAQQQARNPGDQNLGQLSSIATEFVFIAKIIIRYTAGDWTIEQVDVITGTRNSVSSPSGVYLSTVAHDATLTGLGTVASPLGLSVLGTYADNAAALAGGLIAGNIYRTATGVLMIVY